MMIHEEKDTFNSLILATSKYLKITPVEVEKDYYVTIILKELVNRYPNVIFKGGTSLSKCFKIINRFSEDIDLNIDCERKPTNVQRQNLIKSIKSICNDYRFNIINIESIQSRRNFNNFKIDTNSIYNAHYIKETLRIETAFQLRSYPCETKDVSSFVYEYLKLVNRFDIVKKYDLSPFKIKVQCLSRTFIDKIFAICDYYLKNNLDRHSRHIYDLYKLINYINFDDEFYELFNQVKEDRSQNIMCVSSLGDVKKYLKEIIEKDVYKDDYNNNTTLFLYDNVPYETAIDNLKNIIEILRKKP